MSDHRIPSNYSARIETYTEIVKPFGTITGQVTFSNEDFLRNQGMHIQFEGLCCFHNVCKKQSPDTRTFIAGYTKHHQKSKDIVPGIKESFWFDIPPILNPGTLSLPFSLEIPGDRDLPSEFVTPFGSLKYRLSVYIHTAFEGTVNVAKRQLHFSGYSNLLLNPFSKLPIEVEEVVFKKSLLQKKPLVEVIFSMEKSGFLPGEEMGFAMSVTNRKCVPLTMLVSLVSIMKAQVGHGLVTEVKGVWEIKEASEINREPEYVWIESIPIRHFLSPSFHAENVYSLVYSVRFKVKILHHGEISGEAPIYIGTTKEPYQVLKALAISDPDGSGCSYEGVMPLPLSNTVEAIPTAPTREEMESSPGFGRARSNSTFEIEMAPLYSQPSTRASSMETLPPSYDMVARAN